jgi:cytochrome c556
MQTIGSFLAVFLLSQAALVQTTSDGLQPVATMKQLMLDVIYPASNSLLLIVNRRGPGDERDWAEVRRSAMTLAESTNLLIMRNRSAAWITDARMLAEVGTAAYKAAEAKDNAALAALADQLDRSCTTCHRQFRPAVFPPAR